MAKRKSWLGFVKRLFVWDTQSKPEKKEKRRKWMFGIGRLKIKRLPSIPAPPAATLKETKQDVEKLNNGNQCREETEELQVESRIEAPQSTLQCQMMIQIQESSAIKIQTTFRGYLARKALRALKGIVKLQALIRGRSVRRQTMSTLKCLQSLVDIQAQVCAMRLQMAKGKWDCDESQEIPISRDKIIRMDSNSERRWDNSILPKEETNASYMSKKEAEVKRERMKEYSFNHRRSAESERNKVNGRWRYWMEQWVDTQLSKSKELEDLDSVFSSHYKTGEEDVRGGGRRQLHVRNIQSQRQNQIETLYSPKLVPIRKASPHRRQHSLGNDEPSSPSVIPTYMAATESARAKARSSSSPRLRTVDVVDNTTKLDANSPCKKKLSFVPSSINQQRSPSLKGISGPIRSNRTMKDLSINSDSPFLYGYDRDWDGQGIFK